MRFSRIVLFLIIGPFFFCAQAADLSFSARLVNTDGSPVAGPVDLRFELAYSGDTSIIQCTKDVTGVGLSSGVFHTNLNFEAADCGTKELAKVLQDTPATESVMMRVSDRTDTDNIKTYPFQALNSVPMSVMSEVSKTLVQMGAADGEVLKWDGTQWTPQSDDGEPGTVTEISTGTGLTGGTITGSGTISVADSGIGVTQLAANAVTSAKIADGTIANADIGDGEIQYIKLNIGLGEIPNDRIAGLGSAALADIGTSAGMVIGADAVPNCNADQKLQMSLGPTYLWSCVDDSTATDNTKLPLAGGTMSGTINMDGFAIENVQAPLLDGDAATKKYVDDGLSTKADSTQLSDYVTKTGDSMTGALQLDAQNELRLADSDSTNYVALRSNATVGTNFILTLPSSAGSANQVLTTDGTGVLTWSTPSSTATPEGSAGGELAGTYPNPLIADGVIDNANVMAGANINAAKIGTGLVDNTEFNTLDGVTSSIQAQLDSKEGTISAGTTAQYLRGDKSLATLDTSVVPENGNLYYTTIRARTDAVDDAIVDAVADVAPSQNAVFDALALKADQSSLDNYVLKTGDTMTGALNLPIDGLNVGSGQLIATGGNVGIGTTTPGAKLGISGNLWAIAGYDGTFTTDGLYGSTATPVRITHPNGHKTSIGYISSGDGNYAGRIGFSDNTETKKSYIGAGKNGDYDHLVFGNSAERLRIDSNGNVGIGTTAPGAKLEVAGQVKITGGTPAAGRVLSSDASGLASWVDLPSSNTPSGGAGGELGGTYPDPIIADSVIDNANVMTGANVDAAKLGTGIVDNTEFNYLDGVTSAIQTQLDNKEASVTPGTTTQYRRGDKTWQILDTAVVPENGNLYYTTTRARTDAVDDAIVNDVTNVAPSQNAVFDALALKADASSLSNYVLKTGDTMTGALNLPTDGLAVGTNQLIATGGNVGIGVTAPAHLLHVRGTGSGSSSYNSLRLDNPGNGAFAAGTSNNTLFHWDTIEGAKVGAVLEETTNWGTSLVFSTAYGTAAATEKMRIDSSGNVGIGTTSPGTSFTSAKTVHLKSAGRTSLVIEGSDTDYATLVLASGTQNSTDEWHLNTYGAAGAKALNFWNGGNKVSLLQSGNLGLGTTAPSKKLTINSGEVLIDAVGATTPRGIVFSEGAGGNRNFEMVYDGIGGGGDNRLDFKTDQGGGTVMALKGDGNVGVGTTTPNSKLDVKGSITHGSGGPGTVTRNVVNFFTTDNSTSEYIHLRLPFNVTQNSDMYHIKVTGYAYGASKAVDLTYVGYCYSSAGDIRNLQSLDPTGAMAPTQYVGSDNNVYLRFKPSSVYYLSFTVDSMYVGNGRVVKPGEITVTKSTATTL